MAKKPQNRLELRRQYEAAEDLDPMEDETLVTDEVDEEDDSERKPKKKKAAKPKAKTPKAAKPAARMRVVWAVVSEAFKTVATFDYSQKEAALAKAEEMTAKGKGNYFVQKVKEAMPDDAPGLGATVPRATAATSPVLVLKSDADAEEEDEDIEDEEDELDDDEDLGGEEDE